LVLATIFYCLRFETSLFVAFYDSQGHGGGIRSRRHPGSEYNIKTTLHRPNRIHRFQQYLYCYLRICCRGNV
jgi:hypothetical protein